MRSAVAVLSVFFLFVFCSFGCASTPRFRANIQSEDPAERILAIRAAANARDAQSVPLLVDRLEDEDAAVRFFAILALEKITGRRFGYDYAKPDAGRCKAVAKWRAYVRSDHKDLAARRSEANSRVEGGSPTVTANKRASVGMP